MASQGSGTKGVFVSLQAPGYGYTAWKAHRATGVLACDNHAVFPDFPQRLLEQSHIWDVLLVPTPQPSFERPVERHRAICIEAHKLLGSDSPDLLAAIFELKHSSTLYTDPLRPYDQVAIIGALEGGSNMWELFDDIGLAVPEHRINPKAVLKALGVVDGIGKVSKMVFHPEPNGRPGIAAAHSLGCNICCWCCWCNCRCQDLPEPAPGDS